MEKKLVFYISKKKKKNKKEKLLPSAVTKVVTSGLEGVGYILERVRGVT